MQRLRTRLRAGATAFPPATFALNFLTGALDSGVTFTRGSNATLVDSTGRITYAPANLLLQSQTFDNASWTKQGLGVATAPTVTANAGLAPDGTMTADRVQFSLNGGTTLSDSSQIVQGVTFADGTYIFSVWLKSNTGSNQTVILLNVNSGGPAETVTTEWTRFTRVVSTAASASNAGVRIRGTVTGATADVLMWGAQIEQVTYQTVPGTYNPTTTAAYYGPRFDYDPVTLAAKGLLIEEQRVNLVTGSADFTSTYWPVATNVVVTADNTTSPDGTNNADRLADNTTAGVQHRLYRDYTFTAASHTLSVFAKRNDHRWLRLFFFDGTTSFFGNFDLLNGAVGNKQASTTTTITAFGNGWYRCTMTATTAAAAGNIQMVMLPSDDTAVPVLYTGTGTSLWLFGAQLEAGAFATSYIPTVASQVTRSADVATMTGTNFSSWYNQSEGTWIGDWSTPNPASNKRVIGTTSSFDIGPLVLSSTNAMASWSGSANLVTAAGPNNGGPVKAALGYSGAGRSLVYAGGATATDANTIPTVAGINFGKGFDTTQYLNGHIRQIAYYNTRLPNATLQALTA
jgi:hypothetical protein